MIKNDKRIINYLQIIIFLIFTITILIKLNNLIHKEEVSQTTLVVENESQQDEGEALQIIAPNELELLSSSFLSFNNFVIEETESTIEHIEETETQEPETEPETVIETEPETEPETETINYNPYGFTDKELDILYRLVQCEVSYHPANTVSQYHVVHVIINRLKSNKFPNKIMDVIYAENQFTPISTGSVYNITVPQGTIDNVNQALIMGDTTYGSLYFCTKAHWFNWATYVFTDEVGHQFFK